VSDPQIVQEISGLGEVFSTAAYWNNKVYFWAVNDQLKVFALSNGLLLSSPISQSTVSYGFPGATPSISSSGSSNGIVWSLQTDVVGDGPNFSSGPAILRAHDASNVSIELYNSEQNFNRDRPGNAVKFTVPTVANSKVYAGTIGQLNVYGLLGSPPQTAAPTFSPGAGTFFATQSVTLSDATSGASIFYTTDGTTPNSSSNRYTSAIVINSTTTIKAMATAAGLLNSAVTSALYVIQSQSAPPPRLTSVSPNSRAQGQILPSVVLTGSNFVSGATCNFGTGITVTSCTVNSATQITANITVTATATIGSRSIVITNPDTQTGTLANGFNVTQGSTTITLVNHVSAGDSTGNSFSSIPAPSANHTAGNLLVVICRNGSSVVNQTAPTDTAGNQFVGLTPATSPYVGMIQMWYAKNIKGNAANVVRCNFSSPDAWLTISVLQYSGADPSNPLDAQASASGSNAATSGVTPAVTASRIGGVVVVGATVNQVGMTFSAGSGFTLRDSSIATFSGDEDMSVTAAGSVVPSMSWGPSSQFWTMVAAAFK
jgi:hypothetical protein